MKNLKSVLAILITSVALVGCGESDNDSHKPQLRAVHLSPDAPAVDIKVNDATPLTAVEYRQASGFLVVDSGSTDINVLVPALGGASALDATLDLKDDTKYTVIAANTVASTVAQGGQLTPLVIVDDIKSPAAGNITLTVVHGSPSAPSVDVYVTAPGVALPASPLLADIPFTTISEEIEVPAGEYQVRITPAGSSTVVYDSGSLTLVDGVEYVAIAADDIGSDSLVGLTILTDLSSTPFLEVNNK